MIFSDVECQKRQVIEGARNSKLKISLDSVVKITTSMWLIVGLYLVVERGGILAWSGVIISVFLLTKLFARPTPIDLTLVLGSLLVWALAWAGTKTYVISTWESGEVVEMTIPTTTGLHTARTWVLDLDDTAVIYYDAEPEIVAALSSGTPVKLTRNGEARSLEPKATPVDDVPPEQMTRIFDLMNEKYGEQNRATEIYYSMLGRSRDRIAVIVSFETWDRGRRKEQ